jgi:hypothetical protein
MDKILLIDFMNAVWRASVGFSPRQSHSVCSGGVASGGWDSSCNHNTGNIHCICGKNWLSESNKCEAEDMAQYVVVFNFFRNLRPLIEQFKPDKCFIVNRIIKTASRKEDNDKVQFSTNEIVRILQHFPITLARAANYECDDLIATLCENMKDESLTVLSNDTDYIQLLQRGYNDCKVYSPNKKEFFEAPPYPYVAWKCLNGDSADNIPKLLSPKKAINCIADPIKFKAFMEVEENRANFTMNKDLIQFRDVPEEEIVLVEGIKNFNEVKKEFQTMKFESILKSWDKFYKTFDCLKY